MIYKTAAEWSAAGSKRVLLLGMSGVGKTHMSALLRNTERWFHYSVDYRIGTRYMGEHITDNVKREAMRNPFLARLLKSDSIYIGSNITIDNLEPLTAYMGKPGNPALGGIPFDEYVKRQRLHRDAEFEALRDTGSFIERATSIYGYPHFVCDSSGSICEVADPDGREDDLLAQLSNQVLLVLIKGGPEHSDKLIARYQKAPKPMYYHEEFLVKHWQEFLSITGQAETAVDPDEFSCWIYSKALTAREPRYETIAKNWGVAIDTADVAAASTEEDCLGLIARAIDQKQAASTVAAGAV